MNVKVTKPAARPIHRLVSSTLAAAVLLLGASLTADYANAARPGGGGSSPTEACVGKGGVFPAMLFTRNVMKGSRQVTTRFYVSNSLGNCEVLVGDTGDYSGPVHVPAFHFNRDTGVGTLVWDQRWDNGQSSSTGTPVIKRATLRAEDYRVTSVLEVSSRSTLFRAPFRDKYDVFDLALNSDATRLAFSTIVGSAETSAGITKTVHACSVTGCMTDRVTAFERHSTSSQYGSNGGLAGSYELAWGQNASNGAARIYFTYAEAPSALQYYVSNLARIEEEGINVWSTAATVVIDNDTDYTGDAYPTELSDPSVLSSTGQPDRPAIMSRDGNSSPPPHRLDVMSIGSPLQVGTWTGSWGRPSWTRNPSTGLDRPHILMRLGPATAPSVIEIDVDGPAAPKVLPLQGVAAIDSAD